MRTIASLAVLCLAVAASAQDAPAPDPDLAVLSGRVAPEAAGEVTLTLRRVVAREDGSTELAKSERTATVAPGGTFEFAGLPPCLYELTIDGKGLAAEKRRLGVFGDVANVEIKAASAPADSAPAAAKPEAGAAASSGPAEDVRTVIRSQNAGEAVEGRVVELDPSPREPRWRAFRFEWPTEGPPRCWRWSMVEGVSTFAHAGADLPLFAWAKGTHKLRVEAAGFEPHEQDVTVAGATRVELTLKPLAGDYFRPSVEGDAWWIEERGADGAWKPIASWESRWRPKSEALPPVPVLFLTPGEHVLRGVRVGSAPSAPLKVLAGAGRVERGVAFVFPEGRTLRGSLRTAKGERLYGFRAYCFLLQDEKLERERGHDFVAGLDFAVTGLTKGRHVLAFDEKGEHPFAEFDMGEKDVSREFLYKAR